MVKGTRKRDINDMTKIANIGVAAFPSPSIATNQEPIKIWIGRADQL